MTDTPQRDNAGAAARLQRDRDARETPARSLRDMALVYGANASKRRGELMKVGF